MGQRFNIMAVSLSGVNDDDRADTAFIESCAGLLGVSLENDPLQIGMHNVIDLVRNQQDVVYIGAIPGNLICFGHPVREWAWTCNDTDAIPPSLRHSHIVAAGADEGVGTFYYFVSERTIQRKVVFCESELLDCVGDPLTVETAHGIDSDRALFDMLPVYGTDIAWEVLGQIVDLEIFDIDEPRQFYRARVSCSQTEFSSVFMKLLKRVWPESI